jgi:hypothetical protein
MGNGGASQKVASVITWRTGTNSALEMAAPFIRAASGEAEEFKVLAGRL